MTFTVTAPLKGFTGKIVGVQFTDGTADLDTSTDAGRAAYAYFDRHGYRLERDEPAATGQVNATLGGEPFDPAEHNAEEVLAHLDAAPYEEAMRTLDAEAAGKNRVTITSKRDALLADKTPATPAGDNSTKGDQQ